MDSISGKGFEWSGNGDIELTIALRVAASLCSVRFVAVELEERGWSWLILNGNTLAQRVTDPEGEPIILTNVGILELFTTAFRIYQVPAAQRFYWHIRPEQGGSRVAVDTNRRRLLVSDHEGLAFWQLMAERFPADMEACF